MNRPITANWKQVANRYIFRTFSSSSTINSVWIWGKLMQKTRILVGTGWRQRIFGIPAFAAKCCIFVVYLTQESHKNYQDAEVLNKLRLCATMLSLCGKGSQIVDRIDFDSQ